MKFVHYLKNIAHVDIYALTAFGIFAAVFLFAVIYVFKTDKKSLQEISRLPLD